MEQNCLFCKIINKEIPSESVYETPEIYAFLDINPVTPGHTLVLPKQHSSTILDTDDDLLSDVAIAVKKVAQAQMKSLGVSGFNVSINNGEIAGQKVDHTHWHVIPRTAEDGLQHWPGHPYANGEAKAVGEKIRNALI